MSGAKKKLAQKETMAQMGLTEKEKNAQKTAAAKKRNTILGTIGGVIVVVLVVLLLVWNSGFFDRHTTALEVNGHKYTVADMDYWYHVMASQTYQAEQQTAAYYQQLAQLGYGDFEYTPRFDLGGDYKTQYVDDEQTQSYHEYFLEQAKEQVTQMTALVDAADAEGFTPDEETQTNIDNLLSDLASNAKEWGYSSANHLLQVNYGRNITKQVYVKNAKMALLAGNYETTTEAALTDYTDEDLKAYYDDDPTLYNSYDYNFVYFDGTPVQKTDDDGNSIDPTDEEKTAAKADAKEKAENLLRDVKAAQTATLAEGETRQDFAAVAQNYTTSNTVSTRVLGANIQTAAYFEWLSDAARKDGDTEMIEADSGYYVVQFHDAYLYDEPTVDVRHILVRAEMDEGAEEPTQTQMDAAHDAAEALMNEFNAMADDEKTAAAFGILAEEHSDDGRNPSGEWPSDVPEDQRTEEGPLATAGGLYTDIHKGDMVQNFNDWIFDESRQVGDVGLVENAGPGYYGWHVIYFQATHEAEWKESARSAKSTADTTAWSEDLLEGYEAVEASGFSQVGR